MKVKIIKTGQTEEYDSSYAVRLIEQGKAVPAAPEKPARESKGGRKAE